MSKSFHTGGGNGRGGFVPGSEISGLMEYLDMNKKDIAQLFGVAAPTIANWEDGNIGAKSGALYFLVKVLLALIVWVTEAEEEGLPAPVTSRQLKEMLRLAQSGHLVGHYAPYAGSSKEKRIIPASMLGMTSWNNMHGVLLALCMDMVIRNEIGTSPILSDFGRNLGEVEDVGRIFVTKVLPKLHAEEP
jgi:hypothetical protein